MRRDNYFISISKTNLCILFLIIGVISGMIFGIWVGKNNSSRAADKVEFYINDVQSSSFGMFDDNTTIGEVKRQYFYWGLVSRSMLEYKLNEICGGNYVPDDNYEVEIRKVLKNNVVG